MRQPRGRAGRAPRAISTLYAVPGQRRRRVESPPAVEHPRESGRRRRARARARRRCAPRRRRRSGTPSAAGPSPSGRRSRPARGRRARGSARPARASSGRGRLRSAAGRAPRPASSRRVVRTSRRARAAPRRRRTGAPRRRSSLAKIACSRCSPSRAWQRSPPCRRHGNLSRQYQQRVAWQQVAADRAHGPELRAGGEAAGLAQRVRDLRVGLELAERRAGADARAVDPARDDLAHVDERLRLDDPVAEQRHELGPAA